jgi:magnesium-transporting ATPase (P-type)
LDIKSSLTDENILSTIQFTSSRKRASIIVRNPEFEGTDQEVRLYCKGAPDMLFDSTTGIVNKDGNVVSLNEEVEVCSDLLMKGESSATDSHRGILERTVKKFADQAYRTILITYRDMSMAQFE